MIRKRVDLPTKNSSRTMNDTNSTRKQSSNSGKRNKISVEVLTSAFKSNFVRFFALVATVIASAMNNQSLHTLFLIVSFSAMSIYAYFYWKHVAFETVLIAEVVQHSLGSFEWFNAVDDNLLLGAIPLQELQHPEELQRLNISLVLSVVEPFELQATTLVGRPVTPDYWKKLGIEQVSLSSPDFLPPSVSVLDAGADLLDSYLREGKRVYVHCKSGRGRSASVVMAYFCKYRYRGMELQAIHAKLKSRRAAVVSYNSPQMKQMQVFLQRLRPSTNHTL